MTQLYFSEMRHAKFNFRDWMRAVDRELLSRAGLTHDDIPDQPYPDWFLMNMSPIRAARKALTYARNG